MKLPILRVSAPLLAGDFESLPDVQRRKLKDQQYCGFEVCIRRVIEYYPSDVLQIACDLTEDFAEGCITLFNGLRMRHPELRKKLIGISFGDDSRCPPLQAADIVAYCARAMAEHERFGYEIPSIVQRIGELFSSRGTEQRYFVYRANSRGIGFAERE